MSIPATSNLLRHTSYSIIILSFLAVIFTLSPIVNLTPPPNPHVKGASISIDRPKLSLALLGEPPPNTSLAITIFDTDSNKFLYQKNAHTRRSPASLTKIMTAIVISENMDLDKVITIKSSAETVGHSVNFNKGDTLTVLDLLKALLISSGNDAALILAENFPKGYGNFIMAMNKKAEKLGLLDSNFINASGLDEDGHLSSAYDLTLAANYLISKPILSRIVSTSYSTISSEASPNKYNLNTTNELLGKSGIIGIKTGWTEKAGENLITLTERSGHRLIVTVLGSQDRFKDSLSIINWAFTGLNQHSSDNLKPI